MEKEKVYEPKEQKYRGKDATTIIDVDGFFMPVYLSSSVDGLAQAIHSKANRVITFNHINADFHNDVVIPLAEKMKEKGVSALDELTLPKS
jgi:hypothetical protein